MRTALSRVLETARISSTRPATVPTAAEHKTTVDELDATRLSLAKAINDAESTLASSEAELASLKEEARVLEECDPAAEHEKELNGTAYVYLSHWPIYVNATERELVYRLKLQIYKGMGFEPVADKDGRLSKMLVRACLCSRSQIKLQLTILAAAGAQSGDVHCVSFDDARKSSTDYAQLLWKLASS